MEKKKIIIRENIRRLKTKEATQGDKIKQKYQAIKNIRNQIQRREKHLKNIQTFKNKLYPSPTSSKQRKERHTKYL